MKQFKRSVPEKPEWTEYTLCNENGMTVSFIDYGGIITGIKVPDKRGVFENVILSMNPGNYFLYEKHSDLCFGAMVGRVAGRIKDASFTIEGKEYRLPANNGGNCLHGNQEFNRTLFKVKEIRGEDFSGAELFYESPDGSNGFPGNVKVTVTYRLFEDNRFKIDIKGEPDRPTYIDITNHTYFNLSGNRKRDIKDEILSADVSSVAVLREDLIPTGELKSVEGTPFDLREGKLLGDAIREIPGGYDHPFLFSEGKHEVSLFDRESGRLLEAETDAPAFVCYTAGCLSEDFSIGEGKAEPFSGVAIEMQCLPDAMHRDEFPSVLCTPEKPFEREIAWRFTS